MAKLNFTYSYTFKTPGIFGYHCHNHPYTMGGQVTVKKKCEFPAQYCTMQYSAVKYGTAQNCTVVCYYGVWSPHAGGADPWH